MQSISLEQTRKEFLQDNLGMNLQGGREMTLHLIGYYARHQAKCCACVILLHSNQPYMAGAVIPTLQMRKQAQRG